MLRSSDARSGIGESALLGELSETITDVAPDDDLLVMDALSRGPIRLDSWFSKQERLLDLIDGRNVVLESVDVRRYDWPVPGAVQDTSTPSQDLKKTIEAWFVEHGFVAGGFARSLRKRLDDNTELVAAITPESFIAEDPTRRHPLTVRWVLLAKTSIECVTGYRANRTSHGAGQCKNRPTSSHQHVHPYGHRKHPKATQQMTSVRH